MPNWPSAWPVGRAVLAPGARAGRSRFHQRLPRRNRPPQNRPGVLAFVRLDADRSTGNLTRAMEEAIRQIPEVVACHYISGTGTFELQVVARDLDSFSQFARDVLLNLPNVKDMHTSFSLGEVKASGALPLAHLTALKVALSGSFALISIAACA